MKLLLGTQELELTNIDLMLSLNSVPKLRLLTTEKFDSSIINDIIKTSERVKLSWQDEELECIPYGFEKNPEDASEGESYIHALLIYEALEDWFTTKPDAPKDLLYGIYQNQTEIGGWTFLNSCLAHQVLVPLKDYQERIDQILPISTCISRPIQQDNQQFLNTVMGYLQHHIPELIGWTAMHLEEEALRFVFFDEENAFKLDESWENLSAKLPVRFKSGVQRIEVEKTGLQVKSGHNMKLLKELAQHGQTTPLQDFMAAGSEKDLLYLPSPVLLAERLYLCEQLSYSFEADANDVTPTLSLSTGHRRIASTPNPVRLESHFEKWDADDSDEKRVFVSTPDPATWQLMDPQDSNLLKPDADLMAEFVLPVSPHDDYSEFYTRRVAGDQLVFKMQTFACPLIYGSKQKLS